VDRIAELNERLLNLSERRRVRDVGATGACFFLALRHGLVFQSSTDTSILETMEADNKILYRSSDQTESGEREIYPI
jgi:hypothetical protein